MNPFEALLAQFMPSANAAELPPAGGPMPPMGNALANREALRAQVPEPDPSSGGGGSPMSELWDKAQHSFMQSGPVRQWRLSGINAEEAGFPTKSLMPPPGLSGPSLPPQGPAQVPGTMLGTAPEPMSPGAGNIFTRPPMNPDPGSARGMQMPSAAQSGPRVMSSPPSGVGASQQAAAPGQVDGGKQFQSFIRALLAGASGPSNPSALGSFVDGAGGAVGYISKEEQLAEAKKANSAKEAFTQTLAIRKDGREERGAGRADEDMTLKQAAEKRRGEESRVKNQVAVEKMMRINGDGTLPVDSRFKLQDQLLKYADKINKNGLMQPAELDKALRAEQARLEDYYGVKKPATAAPAATSVPDGATATGPNNAKLIRKDGKWVPL